MKVCHSRQRLDPSLHHEAGLASGAGSDGKIYGIGCSTTGSRINNGHDRTAGGCDVAGDDLRGEEIWVLNERLSALTVPLNLRAGRKVAAADREDKSKAAGERTGGTQGVSVNVSAFEVPPPGAGLTTAIGIVPAPS